MHGSLGVREVVFQSIGVKHTHTLKAEMGRETGVGLVGDLRAPEGTPACPASPWGLLDAHTGFVSRTQATTVLLAV